MTPLSFQGSVPNSAKNSQSLGPSFSALAKHLFLHVPRNYLRHAVRQLWLASANLRYEFKSLFLGNSVTSEQNSIDSARLGAMYINLNHRVDRRRRAEREFDALGLKPSRIDAINHEIGLVGCALSHVKAIQTWIQAASPPILLIAEDDVKFVGPNDSILQLISEFQRNAGLDVLCLSHVSKGPFRNISAALAISVDTQTTGCYVIKPQAAKALSKVFSRSARLINHGNNPEKYALDILWKNLQRRSLVFAIPRRAVAIQMASYSDIQRTWVEYFGDSSLPP